MQKITVFPSKLRGTIALPPSKSHTMRSLLFASKAEGLSVIHNYLPSSDVFAMIKALQSFGIKIEIFKDRLVIKSPGHLKPAEKTVDAKNSGQILRFLGAFSSLLPSRTMFTGDQSICKNRPVKPLISAIRQLKGYAGSAENIPLIIQGPIRPGHAEISGEDSQPVSGLLMAACFLNGTTALSVKNPGEKPWIDLTLYWLKKFGAKVFHSDYKEYEIHGPLFYKGFEETVAGDLSSLAFSLAAALITRSEIQIINADLDDVQGDKKLIDILIKMGAKIKYDKEKKILSVYKSHLKGCKIDVNPFIDSLPILAVIACFAEGKTEIVNGAVARKKESDRISSIALELKKMQANIKEKKDGLVIYPSLLKGTALHSHFDHRIATPLIIAALNAEGQSTINELFCIQKSYPSFIKDFQNLGAAIE